MKLAVLVLVIILPGLAGIGLFGYFSISDYLLLIEAQRHYVQVAAYSSSMPALFVAEAGQNIHRVNLFADGVWVLLSAIYMAIGIHAWYVGAVKKSDLAQAEKGDSSLSVALHE